MKRVAGFTALGYYSRPMPDWSRSGFFMEARNGFTINQLSENSNE